MSSKKHLDIGCGSNPRNPFGHDELYGVDILDKEMADFNYQKCNVVLERLPFDDSTFDSVSAYDFLEHIPRFAIINDDTQFPFINFMNEAHRVLKSGGVFYAITPFYPREEAFVDPTHINIITKKTHDYFTAPKHSARMYGFTGNFEIMRVKTIKLSQETKKYNAVVKALKNILYTILYKKKSHILWEFRAVK
ncbi:MAG: class I SAM-dependent methyltransferase [Cocleimonas sp.]|nr:class I SAM-dependent methyltransferase [Cocleimonas sp.]